MWRSHRALILFACCVAGLLAGGQSGLVPTPDGRVLNLRDGQQRDLRPMSQAASSREASRGARQRHSVPAGLAGMAAGDTRNSHGEALGHSQSDANSGSPRARRGAQQASRGAQQAGRGREHFTMWPQLDSLAVAPGSISTDVTGRDPLGPRALRLWQLVAGQPRLLGETLSTADERFSFGQLPVPTRGLSLVVTPVGADARIPSPLELRTPEIPPPLVEIDMGESGALDVRLFPVIHEGSLTLHGEYGEILRRINLSERRSAGENALSLSLPPPEPPDAIYVTHELADGRHSISRPIVLPTAADF